MEKTNNRPAWMDDEQVKNIDPKKLNFLQKIFKEGQGKSQKEMLAYMMPMMRKAKQERLTFTSQEMQAAINAIKKHSTEEELKQINNILAKTAGKSK